MSSRNTLFTVVSEGPGEGWHDISTVTPLKVLSGANEGGAGIEVTGDFTATGTGTVNDIVLGGTAITSTAAEINKLDGVTSAIQGQIDAKHATIDASNRLNANLIGANGNVSNAEYGYLASVTSDIQTQLNALAPKASPTFTGTITIGSAGISEAELEILDGATLSTTELNYVKDVTSAIQTQLGTKHATIDASSRLNANLIGANGNVSNAEYGYLASVTSDIQTQIDGKSPTAGNTSLVTVGTIGTGTWGGTAVADGYIASASTWNAKQDALTFGKSSGNALKSEEALTTSDVLLMGTSHVKGRTYSELKTDLSLNNVANVDQTNASNITSGTLGLARLPTVTVVYGGTGSTTAAGARTNLGVDVAGTDNSTNVTLAGTPDYITISGQVITRGTIDIGDDTNLAAGTGITLTGDTLSIDVSQSQITTVGTIGAGTWQGTAIAQAYIANEAINEAKLQISNAGSNGQVLTKQSGNTGGLTWANDATGGGGGGNLTTKGDLEVYTSSQTRLAIGSNDYVLTADSTAAAGVAWKAASGGGSGDITGVTLAGDSGTAEDLTANVNLTIAGGSAVTTSATSTTLTINHDDTSSQASVDNSGQNFIQDITLDTYGHITAITSAEASGGGSGDITTDDEWDAKGDLIVGTGSDTADRLAVGANDYVLTADSGEATGLKWAAAGGGGGSGDITGVTLAGDSGTAEDLTANVNLTIAGGTGITTSGASSTLTVAVDTVAVNLGGTNLTSYTVGDLLYATGSTTLAKLAKGTADQVLTMNDAATAPGWETSSGGGGSLFKTISAVEDSGFTWHGDAEDSTWADSSVEADSSTDTLKLVAGINVSLSADAVNDAILITTRTAHFTHDDQTSSISLPAPTCTEFHTFTDDDHESDCVLNLPATVSCPGVSMTLLIAPGSMMGGSLTVTPAGSDVIRDNYDAVNNYNTEGLSTMTGMYGGSFITITSDGNGNWFQSHWSDGYWY